MKKVKSILMGLVLMLGIGCNDFQLAEDFDQLELKYNTGYVPAQDALNGSVTVDAESLSVHFKMTHGTTDQGVTCEDNFAISVEQLDELRAIVGEVTYYVQNPSTVLGIADDDKLALKMDGEAYEIREPSLQEAGKFISPIDFSGCLLRLKLKDWVENSGLANNCPEQVEAQVFPEACEFEIQGPQ